MAFYYIDKKKRYTGEHEMHTGNCYRLPREENRIMLGTFNNCLEAISKAREKYDNADGCFYCCNDIYKKMEIKKEN